MQLCQVQHLRWFSCFAGCFGILEVLFEDFVFRVDGKGGSDTLNFFLLDYDLTTVTCRWKNELVKEVYASDLDVLC